MRRHTFAHSWSLIRRGWPGAKSRGSRTRRPLVVELLEERAVLSTFYTSPTGSDDNPGTFEEPFQTLARGASALQPGDTLLVFPGMYEEQLINRIPSGTDWDNPVTLRALDPFDPPVIRPGPGSDRVLHFGRAGASVLHHISVEGFVLDATNARYDAVKITDGAHHIRLMYSEVTRARSHAILVSNPASTHNEFIGLYVHNSGSADLSPLPHAFYISTSHNLIEGCVIHDIAGHGVHIYNSGVGTPDFNVVRNNWVFNLRRKTGVTIGTGRGNLVYNNVVAWNQNGIGVDYGARDTLVYNNTVFANGDFNIFVGYHNATYNTTLRNNIAYQVRVAPNDLSLLANARGVVAENNLTGRPIRNLGTGVTLRGNLLGDPLLVDPDSSDFHLQAESPAVDAGLSLPEVLDDIEGVPRPQGGAYDLGAFELAATAPLRGGSPGLDRGAADAAGVVAALLGRRPEPLSLSAGRGWDAGFAVGVVECEGVHCESVSAEAV